MALPANARLSLMVTLEDGPISGFPLQRRLENESVSQWATVRDGDGTGVLTYTAVPCTASAVSELLLTADYPVRLALEGQLADGTTDLALQPESLVLLFKAALGDTSTILLANPTAVASCVHGLIAASV